MAKEAPTPMLSYLREQLAMLLGRDATNDEVRKFLAAEPAKRQEFIDKREIS